jgi:hypothetical protein
VTHLDGALEQTGDSTPRPVAPPSPMGSMTNRLNSSADEKRDSRHRRRRSPTRPIVPAAVVRRECAKARGPLWVSYLAGPVLVSRPAYGRFFFYHQRDCFGQTQNPQSHRWRERPILRTAAASRSWLRSIEPSKRSRRSWRIESEARTLVT